MYNLTQKYILYTYVLMYTNVCERAGEAAIQLKEHVKPINEQQIFVKKAFVFFHPSTIWLC